jgi:hypothetical protein
MRMARYSLSLSCQTPPKTSRIWFGGLVLLFLISILGLPIHHHADASSSDCPICLAINQPFLTNNNVGLLQVLFKGVNFHSPEPIQLPSNLFIDLTASRAPPFV